VRIAEEITDPHHSGVLDTISMRLQEALRRSGISINEIKAQALQERAEIVRKRYGHVLLKHRLKGRK